MDRINPLPSASIPDPALPIGSTAPRPVAAVGGNETAQAPVIDATSGAGDTSVPAAAASPDRLAALSTAVAAGQLAVDPQAIAAAILRAFSGNRS